MSQGFRHVRIQQGGYGSTGVAKKPDFTAAGFGYEDDQFMNELCLPEIGSQNV